MTDHSSAVKLTGDSGSAVAAYTKAADGANKYTGAVEKVGKASDIATRATTKTTNATEAFLKALDRSKASADKMAASGLKASTVAIGLGKAAKAAEGGVMGVAQSAVAAATAFGPWGVAIGLVGSALISYVNDANAAEKATHDLGVEATKRVRDARIAREQEGKDAAEVRKAEQEAAYQQSKREAEIMSRRTELRAIEDALDTTGRGKDNIALLREEARILSDNAQTMGDIVGAEQIIRDREREINVLLHKQNETRKSIAKSANEAGIFGPEVTQAFRPNIGVNIEAENKKRRRKLDIEASQARAANTAAEREGAFFNDTVAATQAAEQEQRAIDLQRAKTGESIELINREEQARLQLATARQDFAAMEQIEHEAALARIAQRQAAEEAAMAKRVEWADVSAGLASGAIATTNMAVAASGASAKKQEKIAGRLAGIQAMFVGGLEIVKSVAAFASLNIPQGIAHAAAGAFAFTQGALMLSGALPTGASGGGGSSAAMASEPTSAPSNGPSYNTGPIPGSPSPSAPSSGGGQSGGGTTMNVIDLRGSNIYGTPRREFVRQMHQELNQLGKHQRIGIGDR